MDSITLGFPNKRICIRNEDIQKIPFFSNLLTLTNDETVIELKFGEKYIEQIIGYVKNDSTSLFDNFYGKSESIKKEIYQVFDYYQIDKEEFEKKLHNYHCSKVEAFFEKYGKLNDYLHERNELYLLCANSSLSESFFEKRIKSGKQISWNGLCNNNNMSEAFFERYVDNIDWDWISMNDNVSESFFEKYNNRLNWHWRYICRNSNLSEKFFEKHLDKIDWNALCINTNISEEFFEKHILKLLQLQDWGNLCRNSGLSEAFLERLIEKYRYKIQWDNLSGNKNISESFIEKYFNLSSKEIERNKISVDWLSISFNDNLSESFFEKYREKVDWEALCCNKNISTSFLLKYMPKTLKNIFWASGSKKFSEDFFEKYGNLRGELIDMNYTINNFGFYSDDEKYCKVNWRYLCENENLSDDFFEKYMDVLMTTKIDLWYHLCRNRNISISFFEKHKDKIIWKTMYGNTFLPKN